MRSFFLTERIPAREPFAHGNDEAERYIERIKADIYRRATYEILREPDHANYYFKFVWTETHLPLYMETEYRLTVHVAYTDRIATHINEMSGIHSFAPIGNPFPTNPMANTAAEPEEQLERKCVL